LVAGPGLPGALAEVRQIRQARAADLLLPPDSADLLLPPDSSVQATLKTMAGADLAHLACHGQLRSDNPLFSSLLLSDGSLTLYEIVNSGVVPRRMVLAACHAGAEHRYAGGEVLGFASALMARGTAGLVAPTIPLPDGASVTLMTRLHQNLAGGATLPQALWEARASTDQEQPENYVAWSSVTAYGAA
jgi:CHAT domain-containing protein